MLLKLIFYTIFLHAIHVSVSETVNRQIDYDFTLVRHERLRPLEKALQRFLSKLTNSMNGTITLQAKSRDTKDVQVSIRRMCESVRVALARFADDCRLMTVRSYKQSTNNDPLSDDWFSESVLQGAYIFRDLASVINEIGVQIRSQFREANATKLKQTQNQQFLGVIHNAADFTENLSKCLQSSSRSRRSPTRRAILNLAKNPPKTAVDIFRSNLNSRRPNPEKLRSNDQKYWHVVLCQSIMNDEGSYESCMNDLRNLDACLSVSKQRSSNKRKSVDANSWVKAIERLSDCEIRADNQVSCKSARGTSRRIKQKVRYMFERILDRKISKESALHRAAIELDDALSDSEWGRKLVDELMMYFGVFDDGQRKVRRLLAKDKVATPRYKELSQALQTYRKGILTRTFNTIDKMHRSIANFEQFLVHGIKDTLNEAWQSHLKVLSSLMEWMTKLLELYGGAISENGEISSGTLPDNQMNENESSISDDSEQSVATRSKPEIMREADDSMKSLIESMNRVSRYRSTNDTMLSSLANNLLLVTMFMETIGFVSTLYCFDYGNTDSKNGNRSRRFIPVDYKVSLSRDLMLLESRDNYTSLLE